MAHTKLEEAALWFCEQRAMQHVSRRFALTPLAAGSYDISIVMPCCAFEPFAQQNVAIQAGQARQLDVRLAHQQRSREKNT